MTYESYKPRIIISPIKATDCKFSEIKSHSKAFAPPIVGLRKTIPIKLQSETLHFALQNPAYCSTIRSILGGKTHGFAQQGRFGHEPIKIVRKSGEKVLDCKQNG